jgi:hypothetical protein
VPTNFERCFHSTESSGGKGYEGKGRLGYGSRHRALSSKTSTTKKKKKEKGKGGSYLKI